MNRRALTIAASLTLAAMAADLSGVDAASQAAADDVGEADQASMQNDNP